MSTVACPRCGGPVPGLLASCRQPECIREDIAEAFRLDRRIEAADDSGEEGDRSDHPSHFGGVTEMVTVDDFTTAEVARADFADARKVASVAMVRSRRAEA